MEELIYVVMDEEGDLISATYSKSEAEMRVDNHFYAMRAEAIEELGQDGDNNEKDIMEADIYAGQNYPIWKYGIVTKQECEDADGDDVIVVVDGFEEYEMNSLEILSALE